MPSGVTITTYVFPKWIIPSRRRISLRQLSKVPARSFPKRRREKVRFPIGGAVGRTAGHELHGDRGVRAAGESGGKGRAATRASGRQDREPGVARECAAGWGKEGPAPLRGRPERRNRCRFLQERRCRSSGLYAEVEFTLEGTCHTALCIAGEVECDGVDLAVARYGGGALR